MGVTGLWTVLQPVARPVKLETLNRKRLAVDASIWIYQFLKAVRDKEGNALRNSHVVGFFRRICKLLFFGIKPVFVFDGGAPLLKRHTISQRKARREGRREDAVRTAGKLLAVQMQRRAEEEERSRREERDRPVQEEALPEELVYVEEQMMTPQQKKESRQFKRKDAYHLPDLDVSLSEMGAPNDPRIMSQEELEEYARQFHEGEDINLYDFSKIDFESPFFVSLPATDRYNILNAARLRSRLRMGYSKEQLDSMFPDRMAFSRFQIERVTERNELTQRLMNINGMNASDFGSGRIAGEKGKEYMLVKNEGVEGGWALGVVTNKDEGKRNRPIELDQPVPKAQLEEEDSDAESFEDVPVAGLNRLPKRSKPASDSNDNYASAENIQMQHVLYNDSRRDRTPQVVGEETTEEDGDLFVADETKAIEDEEIGALFEDVSAPNVEVVDDEELQRAIAMSLESESDGETAAARQQAAKAAHDERQRKEEALMFSKTNLRAGRDFASYSNARAAKFARRPAGPDDNFNPELRAAFEAGRKMGPREKREEPPAYAAHAEQVKAADAMSHPSEFKGPLPFESIDLGKSLFSKKRKRNSEAEAEAESNHEEGGFQKDEDKPKPLPPWFAGDIKKDEYQQSHIRREQVGIDETDGPGRAKSVLHRHQTTEVIDVDAEDRGPYEPVEVLSSEDEETNSLLVENKPMDPDLRIEDVADMIRAEPPQSGISKDSSTVKITPEKASPIKHIDRSNIYTSGEDSFEWEESDYEEREAQRNPENPTSTLPAGRALQETAFVEPSPAPDFEDVPTPAMQAKFPSPEPEFEDVQPLRTVNQSGTSIPAPVEGPALLSRDDTFEQAPVEDVLPEDDFSDPEDEELMRQLAVEAEEHARFAATLNASTGLHSAEDYERELKQLRNQQKADRRDADEVSHIMITECQQLLRLFGLPYITAPMEAEAQCAELVKLGLVDGIVTDDSDTFLFGGTRVYKNMFNQAKFVECYLFNDLEKEYGLTREKIIQVAHLLGSDYTDGVPGVGPVTALEILTEFGDLTAFAEWWTDVQTGVAPVETKGFKKKFRKNATKIFLPPGFPDPRVDQAYLKPEVDSDPSQFQWGIPDLDALRQFLMSTIGWSQERADEILVPVIKDMNRREAEGTQANITHFFSGNTGTGTAGRGRDGYAPRRRQEGRSARMEKTLERLHEQTRKTGGGGDVTDDGQEDGAAETDQPEGKQAPKRRKARSKARTRNNSDTGDDNEVHDESGVEDAYQPPKKAPRKRKPATRTRNA